MNRVSIYSELPDDEINSLHNIYTAKYGEALFRDDIPQEDRKLKKLIANTVSLEKQKDEFNSVSECIKEIIYRPSKELSLLIYLAMEKLNDWTIHGEERVCLSFIRSVFNISTESFVSKKYLDLLQEIIEACDNRNGRKSGEDYLEYVKNYKINILGREYPIIDTDMFVELKELLEADWFFWATYSRPYARFMLGEMGVLEIGNNKVPIINKEYIRSPQFILNIAAEIFKKSTIIRRESFEIVFLNKWVKYFDRTDFEKYQALQNTILNMSEGIKNLALYYFNVLVLDDLLIIKEKFINEQIEGVYWHEKGHLNSYTDMDQLHYDLHYIYANDGKAGAVLCETLADWQNKKGYIKYILELSEKDQRNATGMYYIFMADYFYPGDNPKEEYYMPLTTNVQVGLAISFIKPNGKVDFDRLASENDNIYKFLLDRYNELSAKLIDLIQNAKFDLGDLGVMNFNELENYEFKLQQESGKVKSLEELRKRSSYWDNMLGYLEKFNTADFNRFNEIVNDYGTKLEQDVLKMVTKGDEGKYDYSLRNYIIERAKEVGIIRKLPETDILPVVKKLCAEVKLPEKDIQEVLEQINQILNGQNYQIIDNHECQGDSDPFILVMQELLITIGDENINSDEPIFDDKYKLLNTDEERNKYIMNTVEDICDGFNKNLYQEIKLIKINERYNILPLFEQLINTTLDNNGQFISDRIKKIEYDKLEDDILIEFYPSLNRGYVDFNTDLAFFFLIMELYPDDYFDHYEINKTVLDFILFEILKEKSKQ